MMGWCEKMNINAYLKEVSSKLVVKDDEKEKIQTSIDTLIWRLKYYFNNKEKFNILDIIVFGSYSRGTSLPRIVDDKSDVDIMVIFENDYSVPQTYLDRIRRAIEYWYKSSVIKQSSPTIILDMLHIKIEITPAIKNNGICYIKSDNNWMITNAVDDFINLTLANKNNNYDIKPIIRLVKYWNVSINRKYCSSYEIEKCIVNTFLSGSYSYYEFKDKLLVAFQSIRNLDLIDAPKAISNLQEAIDDEEKYPISSEKEIKKVIEEIK